MKTCGKSLNDIDKFVAMIMKFKVQITEEKMFLLYKMLSQDIHKMTATTFRVGNHAFTRTVAIVQRQMNKMLLTNT